MIPAEKFAKTKNGAVKPSSNAMEVLFTCKLREARKALKLTIRDVQQATGVVGSTIHRAEHGYNLTLRSAFKLAKFFDRTIDELWTPLEQLE